MNILSRFHLDTHVSGELQEHSTITGVIEQSCMTIRETCIRKCTPLGLHKVDQARIVLGMWPISSY